MGRTGFGLQEGIERERERERELLEIVVGLHGALKKEELNRRTNVGIILKECLKCFDSSLTQQLANSKVRWVNGYIVRERL